MFGASADRQLQEACATEIVCPTLTKTTFASAVWNATRGRGSIRITLSNRHSPTLTEPRSIATDDQTTLPNRHPPASTGRRRGAGERFHHAAAGHIHPAFEWFKQAS